ncbi:glycosyltransferase family 4 protein [Francisella uliginis]|uniref:Glycosyl transferase family 1 n=1 Tax=Francisella uliginis TaxID=573570 RepID=A0A1L4BTB0_9GAMM|nr:glycosyltransferase family 4 protein [Francisella uliginis]API87078.1 hypothetical protein F7310_06800 [Francisella uliginis]
MKVRKFFFVADANSVHTAKWVDWFVDRKFDVYLATFSQLNKTKCKKIYFLSDKKSNIFGGNYYYLLSINKLAKILKDIKPDYINAHFSYSMGLIAILAKKKARLSAEFSVVCHGSDILKPKTYSPLNLVNKYVLKKANKIFAVSDQIRDKIECLGINIDNVFVGQYGIEVFNNLPIKKDIDILSNRNYVENSRIELLLEYLEHFRQSRLNIVFVLPHIQEAEFIRLENKYPFIKFYRAVSHSNMINMVSRSKVYVSATKSDGSSLSLLEAMAYEAIPLVSNIVSNRSWVLDGVNGYLFKTKDEFIRKLSLLNEIELDDFYKINSKIVKEKCIYKSQMQKIENFLIGVDGK